MHPCSLGSTPPHTHPPTHPRPKVELKATRVLHVGGTDPAGYPLAKKRQTLEFLREVAHLRPR